MELAEKFEEATSCQSVNINSLDTDKKYPIVRAKRTLVNSDRHSCRLYVILNPPPSRSFCRNDTVPSFRMMI